MPQKIALALGSGGARGLAHIGVIKALEANDFEIVAIAGCSAGAMVGAWYALTKDIASIEKVMLSTTWKNLAQVFLDISGDLGLISGKNLKSFLDEQYKGASFSNLKIPFVAVATNYETGQEEVLAAGPLIEVVMASGAVPLVFEPYKFNDISYLDGGLSNPVPVHAARTLAKVPVLAVNLDTLALLDTDPHWSKMATVAEHTFNIFRYNLAKNNCQLADYVLEPETAIKDVIGWKALLDPQAIIDSGEKVVLEKLAELKKLAR